MRLKTLSLSVLFLFLAGCASLAPDYSRPAPPVPAAWPTDTPNNVGTADAAALSWQEFFADPQLRELITRALEQNRDLRIALLNIERAGAQYRIRRADQLPSIDASASGSARRIPVDLSATGKAQTVHQYAVGLGVTSWELDLFGRVRSLKQQALDQYLATEQARRSVQISLVAQIASTWLTLAADNERLQLARETLSNQEEAFNLIESRFHSGVSSALDREQARTSVEAARVDIARYTSLVAQDRNALQLLVGEPLPNDLAPHQLAPRLSQQPPLKPGLPSEVLLQRPDILQAENELKGANANIGAARAAFFPRISLVSTIGSGSDQLSGLFQDGSLSWNFSSGVTLPIFNYGRNRAGLKVAQVDRDLAVAHYEKAIQTAFREVADALARRQTIDQQLTAQQALTDATAESYRLSQARYQEGVDSYLNVLDSQRTFYAARQNLINTRLARLVNRVELYQVLGGGSR